MTYLKRLIITISVVLFATVSVFAQTSDPASSSFRVWRWNGDGSKSGGSATAISHNLVVSNVHVVGNNIGQEVQVHYPLKNQTYKGRVLAKWADADVALVYVYCIEQSKSILPWSKIGPDPRAGEKLSLFGYGRDSVLKSGNGMVQGGPRMMRGSRSQIPVITTAIKAIETSVRSVSGDSGGGLFNQKGELVAINWGAEGGNEYSVSTPASYIRGLACYWLSNNVPQDRWKEYSFSQYCQPGMPCQPIPYGQGPGQPWTGPKQPIEPIPSEPISPIQKPDPPIVGPANPPSEIIDYEKIVAMVYEKIEKEIKEKIEKEIREKYEKTEKELIDKSKEIYERIEKIEKGKDGKDAVVDYEKLAVLIYKKMQEDPDQWNGKDGEDGEDGEDANLDGLSFNVQFQTLDSRGNIVSSGNPIEIPIGGTLFIPPQMLRIRKGDAMFTVGAELGSPMRLQNIPRSKQQ